MTKFYYIFNYLLRTFIHGPISFVHAVGDDLVQMVDEKDTHAVRLVADHSSCFNTVAVQHFLPSQWTIQSRWNSLKQLSSFVTDKDGT